MFLSSPLHPTMLTIRCHPIFCFSLVRPLFRTILSQKTPLTPKIRYPLNRLLFLLLLCSRPNRPGLSLLSHLYYMRGTGRLIMVWARRRFKQNTDNKRTDCVGPWYRPKAQGDADIRSPAHTIEGASTQQSHRPKKAPYSFLRSFLDIGAVPGISLEELLLGLWGRSPNDADVSAEQSERWQRNGYFIIERRYRRVGDVQLSPWRR